MHLIRHSDPDYEKQIGRLTAPSSLFDETIDRRTREIVEAVARRGDRALSEFALKFDGVRLKPSEFRVGDGELAEATRAADPALKRAARLAASNVGAFARRSRRRGWTMRNAQGGRVGEKFDPFGRVGIYVPGGTAPLVSTVVMTVTLAKVAGCREIVACTPSDKEGRINPSLLHALKMSGATEIYRLGGAQAIAAMGLGTATIRPVQKIFGPGNAYVVAAKRLLLGHVSIDLLPGPSEVLVLADDTAPAAYVAADLLAQAEHGSGHERVWLVTPSARLLDAVKAEVDRQVGERARAEYIRKALKKNGWLIQVATMADGVALANRLAPEHCEIMAADADRLSKGVVTAGAIFIGPDSPTVLGDYVAGPSHVLPTGGAGASFAGLTVDQFQRRTSVATFTRGALEKSIDAVRAFAQAEGLEAHERSATIRLDGGRG